MSLPSSVNAPAAKPPTNIYTVMLILSFCAILTSCVLLAMELGRFGGYPQWKVTTTAGS